jgi:hypothetical protein
VTLVIICEGLIIVRPSAAVGSLRLLWEAFGAPDNGDVLLH